MLGAAAAISLSYQTEPVFLDLPPLSPDKYALICQLFWWRGWGGGGAQTYFV